MAKIIEIDETMRDKVDNAYRWMKKEAEEKSEKIIKSDYSSLTDFCIPFDMHLSFFYDENANKLFLRTFYYASGLVTYEEIINPEAIVRESPDSIALTKMLIRTGIEISATR